MASLLLPEPSPVMARADLISFLQRFPEGRIASWGALPPVVSAPGGGPGILSGCQEPAGSGAALPSHHACAEPRRWVLELQAATH